MNNEMSGKDVMYRDFQIGKFNPKKLVPAVSMSIEIKIDTLVAIKAKQKIHITLYQYLLVEIAKTIIEYPYLYGFFYKNKILLNTTLDLNIPVSVDNHVEYIVIREADKKTYEDIALSMETGIAEIKSGTNILTNALEELNRLGKFKRILYKMHNFKNPEYFLKKYYGNLPVTNFGSFNVMSGVTAISEPVVSGLVIGKAYKRPDMVNGTIYESNYLVITLSFDHRVIDGAYAGIFLNNLKKNIEAIC